MQSSASESELPDSPSQCAMHALYRGVKELPPHQSSSSGTWVSDNAPSRDGSNDHKTEQNYTPQDLPNIEINLATNSLISNKFVFFC